MWKWLLACCCLVLGTSIGVTLANLRDGDPGEDYQELFELAAYATGERKPTTRNLPKLSVVDGREFDFGTMDVGETLKHKFEIRNDGTAPLTMKLVRTTCKCAIGELTEDEIPPGGTGYVTLEWHAEEYQVEFRQSASIETNDPTHTLLVLSVFGRVVESIKASPPSLVLGNATQNDSREVSLTLFAFKDPQLTIDDFEWLAPEVAEYLEVRWEPVAPEDVAAVPQARTAYEVFVRLQPGMPFGEFNETLRFTLSSSPGFLDVRVNGRIVSDIGFVGAGYNERRGTAELGLVKQDKGIVVPLLVLVKGAYRNEVQLEKLRTDPEDVLDVRIGEPTNYESVVKFPIEITIPPNSTLIQRRSSEGKEGKIVFRTTHPLIPELELPVGFAIVK